MGGKQGGRESINQYVPEEKRRGQIRMAYYGYFQSWQKTALDVTPEAWE
jgi:hypothetical protein